MNALKKGRKRVLIRTVDSDVLVLEIAQYFTYQLHGVEELWIAIGSGKSYRYLAVHKIAIGLGRRKYESLPLFLAFTGCDAVSCFAQIGKKSAWMAWEAYPSITQTFHALAYRPSLDAITMELQSIERHVAILYDRTTEIKTVNDMRRHLFTNNYLFVFLYFNALWRIQRSSVSSSHCKNNCSVLVV